MKIKVEKKHIDNGIEKDSHCCMIADAIKEKCPNAQYILVDLQSIRFSDAKKKQRYTYLTPPLAQHNLLKFDMGDKSIKPFVFSLNRPQVREMGWKGQRSEGASRKGLTYRKTGKKRAVIAYKEREFGLRKYAIAE